MKPFDLELAKIAANSTPDKYYVPGVEVKSVKDVHDTPQEAFAHLIYEVSRKDVWQENPYVIPFCIKYNIPNSAVEKLKSVNAFDVNRFIDLYKRVSNKDLLGYSKKERDLIAIIGREAFIKTIKKIKDERVYNACENG